MSFGKTNQTLNSNDRDFDLNIPYLEDLNYNGVNEFSSSILINISETSKNSTKHMNTEAMDTVIAANSGVGDSSLSFASASIPQRPRRHRCGRKFRQSDPNRFCTNFYCKTKRTPLRLKGPLGPKTLCNACGLQYSKMVSSRGSGSGLHGEDDASPGSVLAQTSK